ncbi:putative transcription factor protein [Rosellinia necatrix]|uniref:Putative transcription factor protein n=1 Tax=Rosellinia necatrix TaxID=77044 RepID=A0A1W2TQG1_ROSNE|nr:putative transcription factor protein [Rosellinia necatrix]
MFQTLKARRSTTTGESAYVVQSAGMPFEKNKGKKQRACTLCKLKKLKCVAEGNSCVKCLKQGLECSYRTTTKSDTTLASKSSKAASKSGSSSGSSKEKQVEVPKQLPDNDLSITVRDRAASPPNSATPISAPGDPAMPEGFSFADLLESEISFDFWSLPNDGGMDIDTPLYLAGSSGGENDGEATPFSRIDPSKSNHDFLLGYSRGGDNGPEDGGPATAGGSSQPTPQTTSTPITEPLGWDTSIIQDIQTPCLGESSKITAPDGTAYSALPGMGLQGAISPQPPAATCHCLEKLMGANEDMQVKLVWGAYPLNGVSVSVDDMLQCQKDILVSCETLLECLRCSLRSDYVMLIVSMCHEMMNGIGDLSATLLPGSQHGSSKRSRSESDGGRKRGLKAGGWRLDDEDEIQVIKSLIGIRITRLGSLISLLERSVKAHHPGYEWVIQALRQSITDRIASIGSEREGVGFTVDL